MRTQSFRSYAAAHGLSLQKLLAFYRRGLLPEYVGRVAKPPISVAAWAARNGISRRTGLALYREEKCPLGGDTRSAVGRSIHAMVDVVAVRQSRRFGTQAARQAAAAVKERASVNSTVGQGAVEIVWRDQAN